MWPDLMFAGKIFDVFSTYKSHFPSKTISCSFSSIACDITDIGLHPVSVTVPSAISQRAQQTTFKRVVDLVSCILHMFIQVKNNNVAFAATFFVCWVMVGGFFLKELFVGTYWLHLLEQAFGEPHRCVLYPHFQNMDYMVVVVGGSKLDFLNYSPICQSWLCFMQREMISC